MKKKKIKNKKQTVNYPQKLHLEEFFKCPIWFVDEPAFVDSLNKASDPYIEISKKNLKKQLMNVIKNMEIKEIWVMYFIQRL